MSKPFAKMPIEAFLDHRLTLKLLRVLGALYSFADSKTGKAYPKRDALGERCGMHPNHISNATTQLVNLGWLEKGGKGGYSTPTSYAITIPDLRRVEPYAIQVGNPKNNPTRLRKQTLPYSGSKTLPDYGSKTLPDSGRRKEQTIELTTEQTKNRPVTTTEIIASKTRAKKPLVPAKAGTDKSDPLVTEFQFVCRQTWTAYAEAYCQRYGTEPVRNQKVNAQVVQYCKRIRREDAPHVAAHFVRSNAAFYVSKGHQFGNLLADAEKLRTEWATGRSMTAATARQIDSTQTNFNSVEQALSMMQQRKQA